MTKEKYSISIDKGKHKKFQLLTEGPEAPFKTMKDLLLASAAIGFSKNKETPIRPGGSVKIFEWNRFDPLDEKFLFMITFLDNKDLNAILDRNLVIRTLEAYANGGFDELYSKITKSGNKVLNLIDYVLSNFGKDTK